MQTGEQALRQKAKQLLSDGEVDLIIGYEKGTLPLRSRPVFIRKPGEVDRLVWNSYCENNLSLYLKTARGKVGIVTKGCDSRSIIELIKDRQVNRDDLFIIGVSCRGVVDRKKMKSFIRDRELLEADENEERIIIKGEGFEETIDRSKVMDISCQECMHRNPVISDILIGEETPQVSTGEHSALKEFSLKPGDQRWEYFINEANKCIRCYACRNACPACYCPECFVDQSLPAWFGKTPSGPDTFIFHMIRSLHVTGRCVDCGACVRACPMGVDLRMLSSRVNNDLKGLYGYEAGLSLEKDNAMRTFSPNDPEVAAG